MLANPICLKGFQPIAANESEVAQASSRVENIKPSLSRLLNRLKLGASQPLADCLGVPTAEALDQRASISR